MYYFRAIPEFFKRCLEMAPKYTDRIAHVRWFHRIGVGVWQPADVEVRFEIFKLSMKMKQKVI